MDVMSGLIKFVRSIKSGDRVAVYHHTDTDGLCSSVIAAKAIERLIGRKINLQLVSGQNVIIITPAIIRKLKSARITKLICTDLCIDENPITVKEVEKFADILVIDHHKLYHNISSPKTVFIKSVMITSAYYPASKMAYDLFLRIVNISDLDWLAAAGTIADGAYKEWRNFVDAIAKKYCYVIKGDVIYSEFYSKLEGISFAENLGKENECYKILYNSNFRDITSRIAKYEIVRDEIKKWISAFEKKAEFLPKDLVFYEFSPTYKIKSHVINVICSKFPHKTLIVIVPDGLFYYNISARRSDKKVAVNDLLTEATKGLKNASGGGHVPAAGGRIRKVDLKKFKQNVMAQLKIKI